MRRQPSGNYPPQQSTPQQTSTWGVLLHENMVKGPEQGSRGRCRCPMPQCAKRVFEETWQLEQHCFDCHGQTRAQLMATSLNHDLEIQERRECPTCKTKCGTFWQLVKHCDEAHQSTVKDLLPRVRGLLEGVTVDDVREAPLCAKARMSPSDTREGCQRQRIHELTVEVRFRRRKLRLLPLRWFPQENV